MKGPFAIGYSCTLGYMRETAMTVVAASQRRRSEGGGGALPVLTAAARSRWPRTASHRVRSSRPRALARTLRDRDPSAPVEEVAEKNGPRAPRTGREAQPAYATRGSLRFLTSARRSHERHGSRRRMSAQCRILPAQSRFMSPKADFTSRISLADDKPVCIRP